MKKIVLSFALLAILSGCITKKVYITKEVEVRATPAPKVQVTYTAPKSSADQESCDIMYTTYKQCYGLGIQLDSTNMCVKSGVVLSSRISSQWGSQELGTALGAICTVACETANRNMAMPSYKDFSENACD